MHEIEHEPGLTDEVGRVGDILWRLGIYLGLGLLRPFLAPGQTLLQLPNAGKVLVELVPVVAAQACLQGLGLRADGVEDALAVTQAPGLRLDFLGTTLDKEPREHA